MDARIRGTDLRQHRSSLSLSLSLSLSPCLCLRPSLSVFVLLDLHALHSASCCQLSLVQQSLSAWNGSEKLAASFFLRIRSRLDVCLLGPCAPCPFQQQPAHQQSISLCSLSCFGQNCESWTTRSALFQAPSLLVPAMPRSNKRAAPGAAPAIPDEERTVGLPSLSQMMEGGMQINGPSSARSSAGSSGTSSASGEPGSMNVGLLLRPRARQCQHQGPCTIRRLTSKTVLFRSHQLCLCGEACSSLRLYCCCCRLTSLCATLPQAARLGLARRTRISLWSPFQMDDAASRAPRRIRRQIQSTVAAPSCGPTPRTWPPARTLDRCAITAVASTTRASKVSTRV